MKQGRVPCAWCLDENEGREEGQSHGICEEHAEAVLVQYYQHKFERVPSSVERFAAQETRERKRR